MILAFRRRLPLALGLLALALAPTSASAAVWGSFDASRVNYEGGVLSVGEEHDQLRALITANGDSLAAGTPTLTANYLDGVDIFYTSLLNTNAAVLSNDEQAALASWVNAGGTLIVSADIFPLRFYESFTTQFGITGYVNTMGASATPVVDHPLTVGVTSLSVITQSAFTYGDDALMVYQADDGNVFMIVLEPDTGFCSGGRILVLGDHNLFTDSSINLADNTLGAQNMVEWAADPPGLGCDCGNGMLDPGEGCDDGNASSSDDCPASCQPATCGDGYVLAGVEACDDGDDDDTDACTSTCQPAACGDGFVQVDVEACDDANGVDTDACPGGCQLAACGDGYVFAGFEECDDGNGADGDGCTALCDFEGGESSSTGGGSSSTEGGASSDGGETGNTSDPETTGGPTGDNVDDTSSNGSASGTATMTEGSESGSASAEAGAETSAETSSEASGGSDGDTAGSDDVGGCGCDLDRRDAPTWLVLIVIAGVTRPRRARATTWSGRSAR